MAPWSLPCQLKGKFNGVRLDLERAGASEYERLWQRLSSRHGLPYPSSAVFAVETWQGPISLLLCESDPIAAAEICAWLALPEIQRHLDSATLHQGNWRDRFSEGIANQKADLIYVEMDPTRFEHHHNVQYHDPAALYPVDLDTVTQAFNASKKQGRPIVIQISSYTANNGNPHHIVEEMISARLQEDNFQLLARVKANGNMISRVYGRNVQLWEGAAGMLQDDFTAWLGEVDRRPRRPT